MPDFIVPSNINDSSCPVTSYCTRVFSSSTTTGISCVISLRSSSLTEFSSRILFEDASYRILTEFSSRTLLAAVANLSTLTFLSVRPNTDLSGPFGTSRIVQFIEEQSITVTVLLLFLLLFFYYFFFVFVFLS